MKLLSHSILLLLSFYVLASLCEDVEEEAFWSSFPEEESYPKRYFVEFDGEESTKEALGSIGESLLSIGGEHNFVFSLTQEQLDAVKNTDSIKKIEEDPPRHLLIGERIPYGIEAVQANLLWDTNGNFSRMSEVVNGKGIQVCIIDSGVYARHIDFMGAKMKGWSPDPTNLPWNEDGCGHGTHVTGTIGALLNRVGVVGVSPSVKIFAVRVFGNDCKWAYSSDLITAIRKCFQEGSDIISMSLGGGMSSSYEQTLLDNLYNEGNVLFVAAAGNSGSPQKLYPASYPSVISVAAINSSLLRANFSNFNDQVDLCAPGSKILSTVPKGKYGYYSGTSMATPHVAGVAALIWSSNRTLDAFEVRDALQRGARDLGEPGRDDYYGYGLVQAKESCEIVNYNLHIEEEEKKFDTSRSAETAPFYVFVLLMKVLALFHKH